MAELANCVQCGRLFAKSYRPTCEQCYKEDERLFEIVYKFIRKKANRQASIMEVSKATEVPEKTILRFVKEGRIRASQFPGLSYPCDRCGEGILEGRICNSCNQSLQKDLRTHDEVTQKQQMKERITYHTEK
ncbi:TIGR03826 family flagellar region protein [Pseudalkalibacillus sp. SCS-8]|uniref:TIGR03826 family flagellar region protein n=1 Tax=Pseudalkalibacillus nanhaiensis TaxID=3115291 RepID=UPI0032DA873E